MHGGADDDQSPLAGRRVAFTGRLASLSRAAAADLVSMHGGTFAPNVTNATDLLVVGSAGWPLRRDGRPTRKLARAEALTRRGAPLEVLAEGTFLQRIHFVSPGVLGLHPLPVVAELVGVPVRQIEMLSRSGLVSPAETRQGMPLFDYRQVAAARSLMDLLAAGTTPRTLRRSLARLRSWLPVESASEALGRLMVAGDRVALRSQQGRWIEPTGQALFDFEVEDVAWGETLSLTSTLSEDLFVAALDCEAAGDLDRAVALYRRLLLEEGPDADACFNLGNILYLQGETAAAAERFRRAAELDPSRADTWLNLGQLLVESGDLENAVDAYALAVDADSAHGDARSGLADVLEQTHRYDEAEPHWRAYLEVEPHGPWAEYARRRLAERPAS